MAGRLKEDTLPAPQVPKSCHLPQGHPVGRFPAGLTCAAASTARGARLPDPGRAGETRAMALGWTPRAAGGNPRSTTQQQEKPHSSFRPRRHARQEARHEPDWPRLCRCAKISGEGCEVTAHGWLLSPWVM